MPSVPTRGTHARLVRQLARARIAATDTENEHLARLILAVEDGAIAVPEAEQALTSLLRRQHERAAA